MSGHIQASSDRVASRIRIASAAGGVLAGGAMVALAGPYNTWVNQHLAVFYAAVEVGKQPVYEPGHYATGFALGAAWALTIAAFILVLVVLVTGRVRWGRKVSVLGALTAVAMGIAVPAWLISPVLAFVPGVAVVVLGALTAVAARRRINGDQPGT